MINIIGLGYIGLPTALMFAAAGNQVIGTDINESHIKDLEHGILYFKEKRMNKSFLTSWIAIIELKPFTGIMFCWHS